MQKLLLVYHLLYNWNVESGFFTNVISNTLDYRLVSVFVLSSGFDACVIYYCTEARQHGIVLLKKYLTRRVAQSQIIFY